MRRVSLRQIEAFHAVLIAGSVTDAALALNVSQPSVSKLVRTLEADTGIRLFQRIGTRLIPTADARDLFAEVQTIFHGVDQVGDVVERLTRRANNTLSVGVLPALAGKFVVDAIVRFRQSQPGIRTIVHERDSVSLRRMAEDGAVDIALLNHRTAEEIRQASDRAVVVTSLGSAPAVCMVPKGHPLCGVTQIGPAEIGTTPLVALTPGSALRERVLAAFAAAGITPRIVAEVGSIRLMKDFVGAGIGVGIAPQLSAQSVHDEQVLLRQFLPLLGTSYYAVRTTTATSGTLAEKFEATLVAQAAASGNLATAPAPGR